MRKATAILITALFLITLISSTAAVAASASLTEEPVVRNRSDRIIASGTFAYLQKQAPDKRTVWVFFTDKGIFDKASFEIAANKINFSEKALTRRSKVGMAKPTFADLPVVDPYLRQIEEQGPALHRVSRWLNAASFIVTEEQLENIAELPFVAEIRPVAKYKSNNDLVENPVPGLDSDNLPGGFEKNPADILDYGSSADQIYQINANEAHNQGYNGAGVIVAMFDTGYRKTHLAFAQHYLDGRVLAEHDFINDDGNTQNELGDIPTQHNHGTYTWSTLGGYADGELIGPAYGASFILAKTEDASDEQPIEEDNWVAALEWVEPMGADVVSSSLAYSDWYDYSDFDGNTAVTTVAANTAAGLGIVICNAMANSGPSMGSLNAPADAFDILAVGAVDTEGNIASFSSRGPTADGRTKPEVCALGVGTYCALGEVDTFYGTKNGTSLSTPLIGGAAAVLIQARPGFTPGLIRQALMETADNADAPDNNYGWGVIDLAAALEWGADFTVDKNIDNGSFTANFTDISPVTAASWKWYFGDGDSSEVQNPSHTYIDPGAYDVTLVTQTSDGELSKTYNDFIRIIADTISVESDSVYAGQEGTISINLTNTQELKEIIIPFSYAGDFDMDIVSVERGSRTDYFDQFILTGVDEEAKTFAIRMVSCPDDILPMLQPGSGEIARITFRPDSAAIGATSITMDTTYIMFLPLKAENLDIEYPPAFINGEISTRWILRGDADHSLNIDILDIIYLIDYKFKGGPAPLTIQSGDADNNQTVDILDIIFLIDFKFKGGPPPDSP